MKKIANYLFNVLLQSDQFRFYIARMIEVASINDKMTKEKVRDTQDPSMFLFEKKGLKIRCEVCGKKDTAKFHVSIALEVEKFCCINDFRYPGLDKTGISDLSDETFDIIKPFIQALYATKLVKMVRVDAYEFTVEKPGTASWSEAKMPIMEAIASCYPDMANSAI